MNIAVSAGAAFSASAFGACAGGGACAHAPASISALTATEIISCLSIVASSKILMRQARGLPSAQTTRHCVGRSALEPRNLGTLFLREPWNLVLAKSDAKSRSGFLRGANRIHNDRPS